MTTTSELGTLSVLPEDALLTILVRWLGDSTRDLARLSGANRGLQRLVWSEHVLGRLVAERCRAFPSAARASTTKATRACSTAGRALRLLALIDAMRERGLSPSSTDDGDVVVVENRVGFAFASLEPDEDDGAASGVAGSRRRTRDVAAVAREFPCADVVIEAHCGASAPPQIAHHFSQARGRAVVFAMEDGLRTTATTSGVVEVHAHGFDVFRKVVASDHPYGVVARSGRAGWAEIYVRLDGVELPPTRPPFYDESLTDPRVARWSCERGTMNR